MLRLRAALLRKVRAFFDRHGFLEVETPLLSNDTVIDRHLDPLPVTLITDPHRPYEGKRMWLQTSPEFAMKRLLASGAQRIFQVAKAFRAGEQGVLHNPEFTMIEWYRVGDSMERGMHLLAELTCELLGSDHVDMLSYREAFQQYVGIDPHTVSASTLADVASSLGLTAPGSTSEREQWLDFLLVERIEPRLGRERPVILFDYPASQSALARVRDDDPPVAERFELYAQGVELANGYHELLEEDELRDRNRAANAGRLADGKYCLPETSRLMHAMRRGLPACAGVALGFDRLAMIAAEARHIRDVMAFPIHLA